MVLLPLPLPSFLPSFFPFLPSFLPSSPSFLLKMKVQAWQRERMGLRGSGETREQETSYSSLQIFTWDESRCQWKRQQAEVVWKKPSKEKPTESCNPFLSGVKTEAKNYKNNERRERILSVEWGLTITFQSKFKNIGSVGRYVSLEKSLHLSVPRLYPPVQQVCERDPHRRVPWRRKWKPHAHAQHWSTQETKDPVPSGCKTWLWVFLTHTLSSALCLRHHVPARPRAVKTQRLSGVLLLVSISGGGEGEWGEEVLVI